MIFSWEGGYEVTKILFIGANDKTSILLNMTRVASEMGKKCLHIDGTKSRMATDTIPVIDKQQNLVDFEGFDIAINYPHYKSVEGELEKYDYIQVDIDQSEFISEVSLEEFQKIYICTTLDKGTLSRTKLLINEIFSHRKGETYEMTLIINNYVSTQMDEDFIYDYFDNPSIHRNDDVHYFNFDEVDYQRYIENIHDERLNIRKFSRHYRNSLLKLLDHIRFGEKKDILTAIKKCRRG